MTNDKPSNAPRAWHGLTRSHVARHLGVGITTVHRMRLRGDLNPTRDDIGVWRYDPADVVRAAARRGSAPGRNMSKTRIRTAGETAARAFQIFEQGGRLREVVIALRLTPEEVRQLYRDFKTSLYGPAPTKDGSGPPPTR
jgi:hypothetical protein